MFLLFNWILFTNKFNQIEQLRVCMFYGLVSAPQAIVLTKVTNCYFRIYVN